MTKKQLVELIAALHEKAYRRGFQQGHLAALGLLGSTPPTEDEVAAWRFKKPYTVSPCAPGSPYHGRTSSAVDRMMCEIQADELRAFFDQATAGEE